MKKIWQNLKSIKFFFLMGVILLCLLLFKNPFSGQNIISDLEPSPDTIHYLNPVETFLNGQGLKISYQGRKLNADVPPLYSLVLTPSIGIFDDIRVFYFTNVILVLVSTGLFYLITTQLIKQKSLQILIFFAFITSWGVYWYPSIAMPENLLITLVLLSIWLMLKPLNLKLIITVGLLSACFWATKYIAMVLSLSLILVYLVKIAQFKAGKQSKVFLGGILVLTTILGLTIFTWIEFLNKGSSGLNLVLGNMLALLTSVGTQSLTISSPTTSDFSAYYIKDNFLRYLFGLIGGEVPVAGKSITIIPIILGFIGFFSLLFNLKFKEFKLVNFYFLFLVLGTFYLISFYNNTDARYLLALVPVLILSAGIFLDHLTTVLTKRSLFYRYLILIILMASLLLNVFDPIKNQLIVNFKTGEQALNYQTIQVFNNYFSHHNFSQKPAVISSLPPYLIDFYSNQQYEILPLSGLQYFVSTPYETWGIKKGVRFNDVYTEKLSQNTPLFVSNYRTKGYFYNQDFERIKKQFSLTLVAEGCNGDCSLYRLKIAD